MFIKIICFTKIRNNKSVNDKNTNKCGNINQYINNNNNVPISLQMIFMLNN